MDPLKLAMLRRIYTAYAEWIGRFSFACEPGCNACCTRSVTMTSLEGAVLVDFLKNSERWREIADILPKLGASGIRPAETFNHYASLCLNQNHTENEADAVWDMAPCFLLDKHARCTVYPVRPFACRGFASICRCEPEHSAEMAPLLVTINTVVLQIIEHLDSTGGCWGNMIDILRVQLGSEPGMPDEVLPARPLPGFLVPPEEEREVNDFLATLFRSEVEGYRFDSLMGKWGGCAIDNRPLME